MKVYKVVQLSESKGIYLSAFIGRHSIWSRYGPTDKHVMRYEVGKLTEPKVGLLYAFRDLYSARRYMKWDAHRLIIFLAEAIVSRRRPVILSRDLYALADSCVEQFWNRTTKQQRKMSDEVLEGTIMCKNITLIERVG